MPFTYTPDFKVGKNNLLVVSAVKSLEATGELPSGPKWTALENRRELYGEKKFDAAHRIFGAMIERQEQINAGLASTSTPVLAFLSPRDQKEINTRLLTDEVRFKHNHEGLYAILKAHLPEPVQNPTMPVGPVVPPLGPSGPLTPTIPHTPETPSTSVPGAVPEPSSIVLVFIAALILASVRRWIFGRRLSH